MTSLALVLCLLGPAASPAPAWQELARGFELGRFPSPRPSEVGDSTIVVLRVDPARFELRLLSASLLTNGKAKTAPEWAEQHGAVAVINASMFRADGRTSLGYLRAGTALNNRTWNKDNAVFVSGARDPALPAAQILDRSCQDVPPLAARYENVVQNIRMLDCAGRNIWAQQPRRWSTAAVGADDQGRVLLIHARSPWSTHDLIDILLGLKIGLRRLMYVEGGPEASLYVKAFGTEVRAMGSFETGFWENDLNILFWPLPNVLAVMPR